MIKKTDQPGGATVTAVSPSGGGFTCGFNTTTNNATCTRGTLSNAALATITLTVTAPNEGGSVTNAATVSAKEFDSNQANNLSATVTTTVRAVADVKIDKTGPAQVDAGASFTYMLTFFKRYGNPRDLHSFPTRPSSDLVTAVSPSGGGFT